MKFHICGRMDELRQACVGCPYWYPDNDTCAYDEGKECPHPILSDSEVDTLIDGAKLYAGGEG
jgi:hypothetical protein